MNSLYCDPVPESCKECPMGVVPGSETPISVEVIPSAGPPLAVKVPS